jgi:hypothetical protein
LQWQSSVHGLKALILAQLYALAEENYDLVWHYKTIAVGWALKHGLHRSQKKMKLGPLTTEMRKRVFWSLYVLDVFTSAIVGLPQMLDERQIDTEFPADLYCPSLESLLTIRDDDYVTEMGFLPTPPGNFSLMSSALALFRACKILSRLLTQVHSPSRVSLNTIQAIEGDLMDWRNALPSYLRVDLPNCAPTTSNFHSHASMLLLVYYWIETLIHRPILASTLLKKDETLKATANLGESSRAVIQILGTLNEKKQQVNVCLAHDSLLWSSCLAVHVPLSNLELTCQIMEIALVYDKSGQIDDQGGKSIENALKLLRAPHHVANHKLLDKRIRLLEQSFTAIPTRSPCVPPKLDTRNLFGRSMSPASSTWTPIPTSVTSNPTFDFNFMRTGRLSTTSTTESVASYDAWTPANYTDRFSTSPEVENGKTDILEAFLSTIDNDPYPPSHSLETSAIFNLQTDSPTIPGMTVPTTIYDWSNQSGAFSDEEAEAKTVFGTSPSDVSPGAYPMFLGSFCSSSEETTPETKSFANFKQDQYAFKDSSYQSADDGNHIHTAPNLFSEETGWAV